MNSVFVKLYTNQGVTDVREGGIRGREATMSAAIQEHERYIVGKTRCKSKSINRPLAQMARRPNTE